MHVARSEQVSRDLASMVLLVDERELSHGRKQYDQARIEALEFRAKNDRRQRRRGARRMRHRRSLRERRVTSRLASPLPSSSRESVGAGFTH
jgi:hypothetical protein